MLEKEVSLYGRGIKEFHRPSYVPDQASSHQVQNPKGRMEIYSPQANDVLSRSILVDPMLIQH